MSRVQSPAWGPFVTPFRFYWPGAYLKKKKIKHGCIKKDKVEMLKNSTHLKENKMLNLTKNK